MYGHLFDHVQNVGFLVHREFAPHKVNVTQCVFPSDHQKFNLVVVNTKTHDANARNRYLANMKQVSILSTIVAKHFCVFFTHGI